MAEPDDDLVERLAVIPVARAPWAFGGGSASDGRHTEAGAAAPAR